MPLIRAVFIDSPETREFIRSQKTTIREIVANALGYSSEDVALYPHCVSGKDLELADNLLPLEFVVDSGTRSLGKEAESTERIWSDILNQCDGARRMHFGIWIVSHAKNEFVENEIE